MKRIGAAPCGTAPILVGQHSPPRSVGICLALGLGRARRARVHFLGTSRAKDDFREDGRLHFNGHVDGIGLAHTTGVRKVLGSSSRLGESRFLDFSPTFSIGDQNLGPLTPGMEVVVLLTR